MPCYHPLPGWYSRRVNESGKRSIVFNLADGFKDKPATVPCGTCVGCQLERARVWAMRCVHESKMHRWNIFVTLTYEDDKLPRNGSLRPSDYVNFMKRLRHVAPGVRFFQCGEYGEITKRPHHHALLFNCDFPDRVRYGETKSGLPQWRSASLERLWGHGYCAIGDVNAQSAGYIARYNLKKIRRGSDDPFYIGKVNEYLTMSRRPGIGRAFLDKFGSDVYPWDECIVDGKRSKPSRYYDSVLEKSAPEVLRKIKAARREAAIRDVNATGSRLVVREAVKEAAINTLKREGL